MKTILQLIFQIFLRLGIAPLLLGLGAYFWFGRFWGPFLIALAANYALGLIVNYIFLDRAKKRAVDMQKEMASLIRNQVLKVPCAYCSVPNEVPLSLATNTFKCDNCGRTNRLYLNFRAVQITDTITSPGSVMRPVEPSNPTVEVSNG